MVGLSVSSSLLSQSTDSADRSYSPTGQFPFGGSASEPLAEPPPLVLRVHRQGQSQGESQGESESDSERQSQDSVS